MIRYFDVLPSKLSCCRVAAAVVGEKAAVEFMEERAARFFSATVSKLRPAVKLAGRWRRRARPSNSRPMKWKEWDK